MNENDIIAQGPLFTAINAIKNQDVDIARRILNVSQTVLNNTDLINGLISVDRALELVINGRFEEALPHFVVASKFIQHTNDGEAKFMIPALHTFCMGLFRLYAGDAHQAAQLLDMISNSTDKLGAIYPDIRKMYLSARMLTLIAQGRIALNTSNVTEAEKHFASAHKYSDELRENLNPNDESDQGFFINIHGSPIEIACLWSFMELQKLNTEKAL